VKFSRPEVLDLDEERRAVVQDEAVVRNLEVVPIDKDRAGVFLLDQPAPSHRACHVREHRLGPLAVQHRRI
jgi:hypothetical protein